MQAHKIICIDEGDTLAPQPALTQKQALKTFICSDKRYVLNTFWGFWIYKAMVKQGIESKYKFDL